MLHKLTTRQTVQATIEEVWQFFSQASNLNLLTPPSLHFQILTETESPIHNGQIIHYRIRILPLLRVNWVTEIKHVVPLAGFVDEQRFGPYKFWHHQHQFVPTAAGVEIIDRVHYALGFSVFGAALHRLWIKPQLEEIFNYRKMAISSLFTEQAVTNA